MERLTLGENLKRIRRSRMRSAKEVAEAVGISPSALTNYEHDRREPNVDTLRKFAAFYGVPMDTLIPPQGAEADTLLFPVDLNYQIPVLGLVRAGVPIYAEENVLEYTMLPSEYRGKGKYFALYVEGDSMDLSRICDGDLLIVREQSMVENGEIAVVLVEGENATVKRVYYNDSTIILRPNSSNPIHKPQVYDLTATDVKILGKVCEVKIKL